MAKSVDFDPMCDKDNPRVVTFEDISAAAFRILNGVVRTPCLKSHMSSHYGMEIYLKREFLQYTGSFKERGARNTLLLLSPSAKERGVISASSGNHAQGLAYHAKQLGIPATVVMPVVAPIMKVSKCRSYGAHVILHGNDIQEAKVHATGISKAKNLTYINGYDHPDIIAGQGTVGIEIVEQVPDLDAVVVPVGGGGLIAGVAVAIKALKPNVIVYGVEAENCSTMIQALRCDEPRYFPMKPTLADGLAVPNVGFNAFATLKPVIDKMLVVTEDWIVRAILQLMELEKCVVEGGGACSVAPIMAGMVPELANKKVVCILTGGNIDTALLSRCIDRGLAAESRLVKFKVTVSDRAGGMAELCNKLAAIGVSIKDLASERAWVQGDLFSVWVKVTCELRGPEHTDQLYDLITSTYPKWYFTRDMLHESSHETTKKAGNR